MSIAPNYCTICDMVSCLIKKKTRKKNNFEGLAICTGQKKSVWHVKCCIRLHLKFELSNKASQSNFHDLFTRRSKKQCILCCRICNESARSQSAGKCGEWGLN